VLPRRRPKPAPVPVPLADRVRRALAVENDPRLRQWLAALLAGDRAVK
jgi:hypothetical protein